MGGDSVKPLLWITYCGTNFCGFQVQPGKRTVQSVLQDALEALFSHRYSVTGCSRTDSGVHARRFCCTVQADLASLSLPLKRLPAALNAHLPPDLSVIAAQGVADDFHVRYCEHEKEYEYRIHNAAYPDPLQADRALLVPYRLDLEAMRQAAALMVGTHDFASFCAAGSQVTDTVRTVSQCRIEQQGSSVLFFVRANGFLYHMVRIMVGTLIEVGRGKRRPEEISQILEKKQRSAAGHTAPAHGLYLHRLFYRDIDCP